MTIAEVICWIFVFATLLSLFIHQRMITKLLTFYSDYYGNAMINSIFRVERLLQDKRGVILYTFERDGVKYEILERKVEEKDNE